MINSSDHARSGSGGENEMLLMVDAVRHMLGLTHRVTNTMTGKRKYNSSFTKNI